jgi:protein-tyrosine phosphatase
VLSIKYAVLDPQLLLGSYPQQPEDVIYLKSEGVSAILNLQSDLDFEVRAINWDLFWKFYVSQKIRAERVPIVDFDDDDLGRLLPHAVETLEALIAEGHCVYLHCTAGVNRSPTVAIAWFMAKRSMSVEEAFEYVSSRRSVYPCMAVLEAYSKHLK